MQAQHRSPAEERRLDRVFRALGDRTRRAILARLADRPAMVTELAAPFDMSLPAASRHVRVLERAGLIARTIDGRVHQCALRPEPLDSVEAWLVSYRQFWTANLDALARFVEDEEDRTTPGRTTRRRVPARRRARR